MTASLTSWNPIVTTNAAGNFTLATDGYWQGCALDDPAIRYQLRGGILATTETLPMWGGVGIYENIPAAGADFLGSTVGRATNVTAAAASSLTGFAVFNQAHAMITNPQSPVPVAASGMNVNYFRLGSGISVPVAVAPSLVSIDGSIVTTPVSWDFVNQQLVPYVAAYAANVFTATTWASNKATFTTTSAHGLSVGSVITVTGSVPTGYNGVYVAGTGTTGSTIVVPLTANPGGITTEGTLSAGGGALKIQAVNTINANGKVVAYNAASNTASFTVGAVAVIQL